MGRICVFCGSNPGRGTAYEEAARALGLELVRRNLTLVYGGASVGLMGAVADAVLDAGGEAIGVIPTNLMEKEIAHAGLTELRVVDSMHERKALMAKLSDGFVALPGGLGTLDELFEVLTWGQLGFHRKPCGLLNVEGYYDALKIQLERQQGEGFVRAEHRALLVAEERPADLLDRFEEWQAPSVTKWIGHREG